MAKHPLDPGALVMAAVFGAVGTFLVASGDHATIAPALKWIWPAVWLGTGVGILLSADSRRRTDRADDDGPTPPTPPTPGSPVGPGVPSVDGTPPGAAPAPADASGAEPWWGTATSGVPLPPPPTANPAEGSWSEPRS